MYFIWTYFNVNCIHLDIIIFHKVHWSLFLASNICLCFGFKLRLVIIFLCYSLCCARNPSKKNMTCITIWKAFELPRASCAVTNYNSKYVLLFPSSNGKWQFLVLCSLINYLLENILISINLGCCRFIFISYTSWYNYRYPKM